MSKRLRSSDVCADCSGPGESLRPGPLPSAPLTGTPAPGPPPRVGRLLAAGPRAPCLGSRLGGTGAALGREPSRACQSPAGGGPPPSVPLVPPVPPVPLFCPRPCREGAGSRPGQLLQQEGAWAIHRKANYRSKMRTSSPLRPPEAAGVTSASPCTPSHPEPRRSAREPCPEWATFATSLRRH